MFYYNYLFSPIHFILSVIGWILVVWLIVWLIRGSGRRAYWMDRHDRRNSSSNPALDVLKERYAKGEISKEEFEEKKKDLTS
jgi:putative membrane protein